MSDAVDRKTILGVFAHPDDESMGPGGTLAKYARAGHRVAFITATDGGAGRLFEKRPEDNTELRRLRREETVDAARILGIESLGFLDWHDGELESMNVLDIEVRLATIIRRERPDVIITFHGSGISYHPDHRIISMALASAFHGSACDGWYIDPEVNALPAHKPARLYEYTLLQSVLERVEWPRVVYATPDDQVMCRIDTRLTADAKWDAINVHKTQSSGPPFQVFYDAGAFDVEAFVRRIPLPCEGDPDTTDLLAGL